MFLIGLTGGIAAGKSTVAKLWTSLGGLEVDADVLAREVVAPGTLGAEKLKLEFGSQFFDSDGNLDRKALGALVFQDPTALKKLESIIHPLVRARALELLHKAPRDALMIYTVPLLVEANVDLPFDVIVSIEAPEEQRIQRLIESRGLSRDEALARVASQASGEQRSSKAHYILDSGKPLPELLLEAKKLWHEFETLSKKKEK